MNRMLPVACNSRKQSGFPGGRWAILIVLVMTCTLIPTVVSFSSCSSFHNGMKKKSLVRSSSLSEHVQQRHLHSSFLRNSNDNNFENDNNEDEVVSNNVNSNRRKLFQQALFLASSGLATTNSNIVPAANAAENNVVNSYTIYKVNPDASPRLSPTLDIVGNSNNWITSLALKTESTTAADEKMKKKKSSGVIWVGEHHNAKRDHILQAQLISDIHSQRTTGDNNNHEMSIGLEQVQVQFQSVLDDYVSGKITLDEMRKGIQWDKRWQWPFDTYIPIFTTAQKLQIPLVALNINTEDFINVEKYGLPGLNKLQLQQYIPDAVGFAEFAKPVSYKTYVEYVILPSYDMHERIGLLRTTMSGEKLDDIMPFRNFLSGRILWDETMASKAYEYTTKLNPGNLMIGLIGADHVKFNNGVVGRYQRMINNGIMTSSSSEMNNNNNNNTDDYLSKAILLNPTIIDTRPPGTVPMSDQLSNTDKLTLQLRYVKDYDQANETGGVLPLADYLVLSSSEA